MDMSADIEDETETAIIRPPKRPSVHEERFGVEETEKEREREREGGRRIGRTWSLCSTNIRQTQATKQGQLHVSIEDTAVLAC